MANETRGKKNVFVGSLGLHSLVCLKETRSAWYLLMYKEFTVTAGGGGGGGDKGTVVNVLYSNIDAFGSGSWY